MSQYSNRVDIWLGQSPDNLEIRLPGSKSESNRAIILQHLAGGDLADLSYLSSARDTDLMLGLVDHAGPIWDVHDAGTTCRFMTALLAITNRYGIVTGSARMQQRPIALLVDALGALGAQITYQGQEGFLPIQLEGFTYSGIDHISIPANISSQYISALMMVAPLLPNGLIIKLTGQLTSWPYIELTIGLMRKFGATIEYMGMGNGQDQILIHPCTYRPITHHIEADWSSASYWYSFVALCPDPNIKVDLPGLRLPSTQGDSYISAIMPLLGVETTVEPEGIRLRQIKGWKPSPEALPIDFTDIPDMAQTLAVMGPALGQNIIMSGLHTLRIKETDRIAALQTELPKVGIQMKEIDQDRFLVSSIIRLATSATDVPTIETYHDHRMAMAFAPLAQRLKLSISDPAVVNKSYPAFWDHLSQAGMEMVLV